MKLNKLMAVLAAGVSVIVSTGVCSATTNDTFYFSPAYLGVTNLPLSFSGTAYVGQYYSPGYSHSSSTYSNLVKKGGNLASRKATVTTNYTQYNTNNYAESSYYVRSFGVSDYVGALNSDSFFTNTYGTVPTNAQLTYVFNRYNQGQFWLTTTNGFAFNLSSNWWVYSWTNLVYSGTIWDTNVFTVSNQYASSVSPQNRLSGFYANGCGVFHNYTNTPVYNDFSFQAGGGQQFESQALGFTGNLGNLTSGSFYAFNGVTNIQSGELYLSSGPKLTFVMAGSTVITANQTATTNTLAGLSWTSPAVTVVSLSAMYSGSIGSIDYVNTAITNLGNRFSNSSIDFDVLSYKAGFIGTTTGSLTSPTTYYPWDN